MKLPEGKRDLRNICAFKLKFGEYACMQIEEEFVRQIFWNTLEYSRKLWNILKNLEAPMNRGILCTS